MVRIKGANSDYIFDVDKGQIIEQTGEHPVYLKIFLCPHDMPSHVEAPYESTAGNWCQGIDAACPHPGKKDGHALISLHQTDGIAFITQNTIAAKGNFVVQPPGIEPAFQVNNTQVTTTLPFVMQPKGKEPVLKVSETELRVTAPVVLQTQKDKGFQLSVTPEGIVLQTPDGAIVQMQGNTIEITPGKTGKVKINGNLEVTGEVTVAGKKLSV